MTDPTPTVPAFVPAQRVRSFDHIVDQIRDAISSGGIAPGERLPSERDLGATFGVSRTTLREALRALEAQGVLEIRTGSRGGAFVAEPSSELVAGALGNLLRFRSATARELAEFRVPFEAENAAWAARRADPSALAELEHIVGDVVMRARRRRRGVARGRGARGALPRGGRPSDRQLGARSDHERHPRRARARVHRGSGASGLTAAR